MRTTRTCGVIAAALVIAAVLPSAAAAGAPRLTKDEEAAVAAATVFSKAFTAAAKIIRPAVVNIRVTRQVAVRGFNNPFEFFPDFFGPGFPVPGGPRMPGGPGGNPRRQREETGGSGVIIDAGGYILTNNHVVGDADSIHVFLLDGREYPAELIGADPASDVAVIKIDAGGLTVAELADSDLIEVGEWVLAVGNPFGLDFTVTSGIISARGRTGMNVLEMEDFIQTDASINPGNSGGPLVNLRGEVIGINTFIYSPGGNAQTSGSIGVGFAIPSNMANNIMKSLISHRMVTSSYLGVETQTLTQELAEAFGLAAPRGALVQSVGRDSPAEKAGLQRGDVVVRWGRRVIQDDRQFRNLVMIATPGQPVEAEVIRDGRTELLSVVPAETPPEMVIKGRGDRFLQSLGIQMEELTPELREALGYEPDAFGALVTDVRRGSPAHRIGFQPGSLVLSVNGGEIRDVPSFRRAIGGSDRVKDFTLVWRTGEFHRRVTLTVE